MFGSCSLPLCVLVFLCSSACFVLVRLLPLQIVKIGPNPRLALHQLVSRARLPRFGVSPPRDSSLFLLCSSPIQKSPQKIAIPKICSLVGFCVVLLVLIHGSDAILVDLPPFAFLRPNFSFSPFNLVLQVEIFRPKSSFGLKSRPQPTPISDVRKFSDFRHFLRRRLLPASDVRPFSDVRNPTFSDVRSLTDVRNPATWANAVLSVTSSSGVRFRRSCARFVALDIPYHSR